MLQRRRGGETMLLVADRRVQQLFDEYAEYHRHPTNKLCHYIGIPLIVFSLVGCVWQLSPPRNRRDRCPCNRLSTPD